MKQKVSIKKTSPGKQRSPLLPTGSKALQRIQVIDRAVRILDCFTFDKMELTVTEISLAAGLHKSTTHRILAALQHNQVVEQDQHTGKYHLGVKLFKLGHQAAARLNLRDIARPHLQALMEETGETVHLSVLDNARVLYLEKVECPHALRMPSRVGRLIPTYCTSLGKAMLSCLDDAEVRRIVQSEPMRRYTPNTLTTLKDFQLELKKTHARGYAIDNEEIELGLRCLGSPIRDHTGQMVGAISIAGPSARVRPEKNALLGGIVLKVASLISRDLGFERVSRSEKITG